MTDLLRGRRAEDAEAPARGAPGRPVLIGAGAGFAPAGPSGGPPGDSDRAAASLDAAFAPPAATQALAPARSDAPSEPALIINAAHLPPFQGLLTAGEAPLYNAPPTQANLMHAIDLGALTAAIVVRGDVTAQQQQSIDAHLAYLRGAVGETYSVQQDLIRVSAAVMAQLPQRCLAKGKRRAQSPALELFFRWIQIAAGLDATDVHVQIEDARAFVRIRWDGVLVPIPDNRDPPGVYAAEDALNAVAAAYNDTLKGANSSNYVPDKFIDCMLAFDVHGAKGQLRYQNFKGRRGPKVVVRILREDGDKRYRLDNAGYADSHLKLWRVAARTGKGLVIIAGVTNSGKSTTLVNLIESLPGLEHKAIYTVEDPIEYEISGAHQIEVLRDLADDEETRRRYGAVIKALMRGDLDGASIGEIRDELTANFALTIAETGHLAMATLHAHLIANMVPRLANKVIGLGRDALTGPSILNLLVYQGLVPVLCPHCKLTPDQAAQVDAAQPTEEALEVREVLEVLGRRFALDCAPLRFKNPRGCEHCGGRGTRGKTIVAEMWQPDRAWLEHVRAGRDYEALMHYRSHSDRDFASANMTGKTVFEHTLWKALQGILDVRNCEEFEGFERFEMLAGQGAQARAVSN